MVGHAAEAAYLVGTSPLSTSGSQPYTVGTILDRSVVYPSLLTTDVVSYQPYNLFNLKDIGYSSYSRVTSVSGYSNLFLYDYVSTNLGSFTYSASGSGSLSYQLNPLNGDLSTPVSLVSFNSGTSARVVSNMSFSFPSDVPCLESGVEYSFYFLVDHIGVDNFSISPVWQDTVSISDLVYNVNPSFDNVYGRLVVNSSDLYLTLSGLKMSFDCNWSVASQGSKSTKRLYGFSFWRTTDDDSSVIDAINNQTNVLNQSITDAGQGIQDKIESQFDISQGSEVGSAAQDFANQASESLGVVSYIDTLFSGLSGLVTAGSTTLTFPALAFAVEGTEYQFWEEYTFDLAQLDGWFAGLMAAVRLATSTVVVGAVIHYLQSVYKDVIG